MHICLAEPADAATVARIYNHYIRETWVTFELEEIDADTIAARMQSVLAGGLPWLVAREGPSMLGYAYASHWHTRHAYRHSVETTIYLAPDALGQGYGRRLYATLLSELRERPVHTAIGGISLPNAASVGLHEALGFVKVGHLAEVGYKFDRWIDVGYWQLRLPARP